MQTLTDALLVLFLALGSAWFAVDLVRKLRQPAAPGNAEPQLGRLPSTPEPAPAPMPAASPAPMPVSVPAPPLAAAVAAPLAAPAPEPLPTPAPATPALEGVPTAHLAVISAVVHHVFTGRARLAAVLPAPVGNHSTPPIDWAREGRRDIFTSHRVR
jgi:hypothetical protein